MSTLPSKLDQAQVLQHVFDEDLKSLRVASSATIVPGSFDVALSAADDTIAIADATSGAKAGVTSSNELKVLDINSVLPTTPTINHNIPIAETNR